MDLHDKSHYGALSSYTWRLFFWLMSVSQGIYPVVVVILVHSQKSYIEDSTTVTSTPFEFASVGSRSHWGSSGRSFPKLIEIHQTHAVELDAIDSAELSHKRTSRTVSGSTTDLRLAPELK